MSNVAAKHPGNKRRTTISDVAKRAGVSPATVSNLLNGKGRLGDDTRVRIHAAMEDLHFTPNALIRALQKRRTYVLGLLIYGLTELEQNAEDSLVLPLLAGIYQAADAAGQDILVYTGWPDRADRSTGLDFLDGRADGLLWLAPAVDSPALQRVAAAELPVVAMLSRRVPANLGYVDTDNVAGARDLVAHIAAQGHTRIAFAGPIHASNFLDRLEGYRLGLAETGILIDPMLIVTDSALRDTPEAYARALDSWLQLPDPPTAVFVCVDRWASWLAQAAAARGLSIPGDLSLAGFDDLPSARTLCGGLTTVHQPFKQVGQRAVEQLLRLIEGIPAEECRVMLPLPLVVRASTAAAPSNCAAPS